MQNFICVFSFLLLPYYFVFKNVQYPKATKNEIKVQPLLNCRYFEEEVGFYKLKIKFTID